MAAPKFTHTHEVKPGRGKPPIMIRYMIAKPGELGTSEYARSVPHCVVDASPEAKISSMDMRYGHNRQRIVTREIKGRIIKELLTKHPGHMVVYDMG